MDVRHGWIRLEWSGRFRLREACTKDESRRMKDEPLWTTPLLYFPHEVTRMAVSSFASSIILLLSSFNIPRRIAHARLLETPPPQNARVAMRTRTAECIRVVAGVRD